MNDLFSKDKINTGRQIELDIAKSFSTIFMIFIHSLQLQCYLKIQLAYPTI